MIFNGHVLGTARSPSAKISERAVLLFGSSDDDAIRAPAAESVRRRIFRIPTRGFCKGSGLPICRPLIPRSRRSAQVASRQSLILSGGVYSLKPAFAHRGDSERKESADERADVSSVAQLVPANRANQRKACDLHGAVVVLDGLSKDMARTTCRHGRRDVRAVRD